MRRTIYTPNEIVKYDGYAEIVLYNRKCIEVARALVELADVERCSKFKWCLTNTGYVSSHIGKKQILLHKFIMPCEKPLVVDHINRNKLDCRKSNLRIVTQAENTLNRDLGNMGIKKTSFGNWIAYASVKGYPYSLGTFSSREEALDAKLDFNKNQKLDKEYYKKFFKQKHKHRFLNFRYGNKVQVQVSNKGKSKYLGIFDSLEDAILIRNTYCKQMNIPLFKAGDILIIA